MDCFQQQIKRKNQRLIKQKQLFQKGKDHLNVEVFFFLIFEIIFYFLGTTFVVDEKYEYIKQIGHGAYGVVCSALNKENNNKVAIKKVIIFYNKILYFFKSYQVPNAFDDLIDAKRIVREIKLLSILKYFNMLYKIGYFDHENIITLVDLQRPPSKTGYNDIYIYSDLMETDLHRVIYSRQV